MIELSGCYLETSGHQCSASAFSSGDPAGFCYLPTSFRLDGTDGRRVHSKLCPSSDDVARQASSAMPLAGEKMGLKYRGEVVDDILSVSAIASSPLSSCFKSVASGTATLNKLGLDVGIATASSFCDHRLQVGKDILGVIELKGGDSGLLEGSSQAAAYGTHVAMKLYQLGIDLDDIVVPSYTYNGMLIQFGATFLLEPSVPVYYTISKVLDTGDFIDRKIAMAFIHKANCWVRSLHEKIQHYKGKEIKTPTSNIKMLLDTSRYFIKKLTPNVLGRGFGLLCDIGGKNDVSQGIEHWGRVMNCLYNDPAVRPYVAFPLAIRTPDQGSSDYAIVFKDLTQEGFTIGAPNRNTHTKLFDTYRQKLRELVNAVHMAGVIHVDLYPSNIMWKARNKSSTSSQAQESASASSCAVHESFDVDIVIIDWDCSHCLDEGDFRIQVSHALRGRNPTRDAPFAASFDDFYVDVFFREHYPEENSLWDAVASGSRLDVDRAFYQLFVASTRSSSAVSNASQSAPTLS